MPSVQSARLRTLFHSKWATQAARSGLIAALALITWTSLAPAPDILSVSHVDKVLHLLAYGSVAGLAVIAKPFERPTVAVMFAVLLASAWGGGVEVLQGAMPLGRTASLGDAIANVAGACIGAITGAVLMRAPR